MEVRAEAALHPGGHDRLAAPSNHAACGGIEQKASSRRSADHGRGVVAVGRVHVALEQGALLLGRLVARRPVEPVRGRCCFSVARARCSALFAAATLRSSSDGALGRRPAEHVAQDQHRPLLRRQELDRRDERQLDRLPRDDLGLRLLVARRDPLEQVVRIRLQPRDLGQRLRRRMGPSDARPRGSSASRQAFVAIR